MHQQRPLEPLRRIQGSWLRLSDHQASAAGRHSDLPAAGRRAGWDLISLWFWGDERFLRSGRRARPHGCRRSDLSAHGREAGRLWGLQSRSACRTGWRVETGSWVTADWSQLLAAGLTSVALPLPHAQRRMCFAEEMVRDLQTFLSWQDCHWAMQTHNPAYWAIFY